MKKRQRELSFFFVVTICIFVIDSHAKINIQHIAQNKIDAYKLSRQNFSVGNFSSSFCHTAIR